MKLLMFLFCIILKFSICASAEDASSGTNENVSTKLPNPIGIQSQSTRVAAVGRVADLGDLYDARTDNFLHISLYTADLSGDAVHWTDNTYSNVDYVRTESLSEKLEKLGVEESLSVSILGGIVNVSGSGKYLIDDKRSAKSAKASLVYSIRTGEDNLKIFSKTSKEIIDRFLLANADATHIVIGREWGTDIIVSLEETKTDSTNFQQIQQKLNSVLNLFARSVSEFSHIDFDTSDVEKSSTFSLYLNGDIIPTPVPQTINKAIVFIRNIPELIEKENGGKGQIMSYLLMPIATVQKFFQGHSNMNGVIKDIDLRLINDFMQIFQEIKDSQLQINDVYNAMYTWKLLIPDFKKILVLKSQFDTFVNELKQSFANIVVQFRSGRNSGNDFITLIKSYERSNWTVNYINTALKAFTMTMNKIELMKMLQNSNALFICSKTEKYKIIAENYKNEIRIVSFDLTTDISSSYVSEMIKLLKVESAKGSEGINYYIEDSKISVPEVNSYLEGKVIHTFPADKKEYILIGDDNGKVIIINANSYEQTITYNLPNIAKNVIIIVNSTLYSIDTRKGIILSTDVANIMEARNSIKWTQVGSFPSGDNIAIHNSATINESDIYFSTHTGRLYSYNMLSKTVTFRANLSTSSEYNSLIIVDKILYIHGAYSFVSFDGNVVTVITPPDRKVDAGLFRMGSKVCRVGGNFTEVNRDPVDCYDPRAKTWTTISYINDYRRYPAVVTTLSGTYIFGGQSWWKKLGTISQPWRNSAEMFNYKTNIWSYIPTPLVDEPPFPQPVRFFY